jgi:hypothetical protein
MSARRRPGNYMPQRDQAIAEQQAADRIVATVERVEHFLYLRKKFGPKETSPKTGES